MSSPGCQLRTPGGRPLLAAAPNSNATANNEEAPGKGLTGEGRGSPHPATESCPRLGAGSVVGKLRAPDFHSAPPRNVWAGRRVRVLFVCDYWGARVEASSCVCVCARSATPGYQCARVRVSRPVLCGHVLVHACAVPECFGLVDAHDSSVPCTCEFVYRSKGRGHSRRPGSVQKPLPGDSAQTLAVSAQRSSQEPVSGSCPARGWGRVVARTARLDCNLGCNGSPDLGASS